LRRLDRRFHIRYIFRKYHGETFFQVPINVAVEEPRARVVSHEPDRDTIVSAADAYDIADDRILEVVCRTSRTTNDVKGMPMQVERVRPAGVKASSTTREDNFNALISPDWVDASVGEEL